MRKHHVLSLFFLTVATMVGSARLARADEDQAKLTREAEETVARFKQTDPGLAKFFKSSAGYAVFPTVGKGGLGVGGAHGDGVLFDASGRPRGKASVTQVTVG